MAVMTLATRLTTERLVFRTREAPQFIDITDQVQAIVDESGITHGQVTVFSQHTTAAIRINESEPLLLHDFEAFLERVAPEFGAYRHNDFTIRTVNMTDDECANAHAHCRHLLMSTSETVPVVDGGLCLGTWQRIFLVELDHGRERSVIVQVLGQ
jgi:secondary thiamine-phosphate synthase enzyme